MYERNGSCCHPDSNTRVPEHDAVDGSDILLPPTDTKGSTLASTEDRKSPQPLSFPGVLRMSPFQLVHLSLLNTYVPHWTSVLHGRLSVQGRKKVCFSSASISPAIRILPTSSNTEILKSSPTGHLLIPSTSGTICLNTLSGLNIHGLQGQFPECPYTPNLDASCQP